MTKWLPAAGGPKYLVRVAVALALLLYASISSAGKKQPSYETYDQGHEVQLTQGLLFKVTDAYWTDHLSMPGIPEQFQTGRSQVKASGAFLVVDIAISNPTSNAVSFGGFNLAPMLFRLMN